MGRRAPLWGSVVIHKIVVGLNRVTESQEGKSNVGSPVRNIEIHQGREGACRNDPSSADDDW
jgi:hypothetical protein